MSWTLVNWCPEESTFDVTDAPEPTTTVWETVKPWLPVLFGVVKAICGGPM